MLYGLGAVLLVLIGIYHAHLWDGATRIYASLSSREKIQAVISRFGTLAPVVFVCLQFLQVILAPIPGEATGVIGGYLFGTFNGFVLSSLALALGSLVNFLIGRFLGRRFVRRWIPDDKLKRFDTYVKHQGVLVLVAFFVFPGFPKDYLCLFLGMTMLPLKAFFVIAAVGRMPGTLMLSLQGASLYEGNYVTLAVLVGICLAVVLIACYFRERIYAAVDRMNHHNRH